MAKFAGQLPEALELIARALRAGHSLAAGFNLVAQEMSQPIAGEFSRAEVTQEKIMHAATGQAVAAA